MTVACFAAMIGWLIEQCEVAIIPAFSVEAAMPEAQVYVSKPGPCGLSLPPKPRQRATGTKASNSIASASFASATVFGQLIFNRPSTSAIRQP